MRVEYHGSLRVATLQSKTLLLFPHSASVLSLDGAPACQVTHCPMKSPPSTHPHVSPFTVEIWADQRTHPEQCGGFFYFSSVLFPFVLETGSPMQPRLTSNLDSASQALPRFPRDYRSEAQHPALAYSLQGADLIYQEETIPSQFQTQGGSGYLGHSICSLCSRLWLGGGGWENTRRRGNGECWSECGRDQWLLYQLVFHHRTH